MEAKKWFHAAVIALIVVGLLSATLLSNGGQLTHNLGEKNGKISTTFLWVKNTVLNIAMGIWQFNKSPTPISQQPHLYGLSPNLSSCHKSYAKDDYMVYCCPPNEAVEPVIDFKFPDPSEPKKIRKRVHLRDREYLAKYKKAVTIMKSLPYSDPRSYARQADMHCIYCTGAYNQKNANVGLNIHRSWLFFPWHRMLIYFHERILGKLIGDDTFSLSFWQWDAPEGMTIPEVYFHEPFIDTQRSANHIKRGVVAEIDYNKIEQNRTSEAQIASNLAFMYTQMVSGAKKMELFMGCIYKPGVGGSCDGPGTIENAPHNALHTWVGKESNRYLENMGVFYSAARDPIFWAHHPNIDRLWESWKELRNFEPEIIDPDWLDTYFYFHDENAQLVRIRIRDVLNITNMNYEYEQVDLPWLDAKPKPSVDPAVARHTLNTRDNGFLSAQPSDFGPKGRRLDNEITVKVHRPNVPRRTEKGKEEEEVVLVVYGIDKIGDVYVKFDVFVNAIDAESLGPTAREFAGSFINVPRGVTLELNPEDEKIEMKTTLKLGISELLQDLQADGDDFIWVTLVPRGGSGVSTTVDGIRLEYMI